MPYKISKIEIDKTVVCFLAIDDSQEIAGKCSFKLRENDTIRYQDAYVNENHRGKGVYTLLFNARQNYVDANYPSHTLQAYCRDTTIEKFKKNKFKIIRKLYWVEKTPKLNE